VSVAVPAVTSRFPFDAIAAGALSPIRAVVNVSSRVCVERGVDVDEVMKASRPLASASPCSGNRCA
jgi:hypothetical protein